MKEYLISGFKLDAFRLINARIIVEYKKIYSNKNTICLLIGLLLKKKPVLEYTTDKFLENKNIHEINVDCHKNWIN